MSDYASSPDSEASGDGEGEQVMYRCRKCPNGEEFTAAERDLHRAHHRATRRTNQTRSGREDDSSVPPSTMFDPVAMPKPTSKNGKDNESQENPEDSGRENKRKKFIKTKIVPPKKVRKIRSFKKFDRHVEFVSHDGG